MPSVPVSWTRIGDGRYEARTEHGTWILMRHQASAVYERNGWYLHRSTPISDQQGEWMSASRRLAERRATLRALGWQPIESDTWDGVVLQRGTERRRESALLLALSCGETP
ncbi:hypothetical protein [Thermomonospora cellulosilytica]|uniref:Uncharacterized protein n=1 Tax=Thermomonospora cellulosilytica TaxID=1411118 RepID=A0A7W3N1W2_9ACTN|nr:hypothetical protein [Thermomonospora cellulosilytica]MBA9006005.1 hypothetical protein [Thermomonospora cellulosilytica]